jgi:hypothetical protein
MTGSGGSKRRTTRDACRIALSSTLPLLASACLSYSYVDSNNRRHVVGLVNIEFDAAEPPGQEPHPSVITVTSVGVRIFSNTPSGSGVIIGYGKETTVVVPDNSCIDVGAPGACAKQASTER